MPLTDTTIRKAKDPGKLADGGGLYLLVKATGGKWWRLDYRRPVTGKRNTLSLGTYPETSLAEEARALIREGLDPAAVKAEQKTKAKREAEGICPKVAAAWLAYDNTECQWAPETLRKAEYIVRQYLERVMNFEPIGSTQ